MENVKFCPSCGSKLEGNVKFCPSCGKPLGQQQQQTVPLEEKKGCSPISILLLPIKITLWPFTLIYKVAKKFFDKKQVATKRGVAVTSLKYKEDAPEKTIGKCGAVGGDGFPKKWMNIVFTNKEISVYRTNGPIMRMITKNIDNIFLYRINLKDIVSVSRSRVMGSYDRVDVNTNDKTYTFYFSNNPPYTFYMYLSKVLNFESSIFNIDLLPNEEVKMVAPAILGSGLKPAFGTLYLTNKRLVYTKMTHVMASAKTMKVDEGTELVFSVELEQLKNNIFEKRGVTTCEYVINCKQGQYTLQFEQLVPGALLALIPGAEGNKDILERKKNIKKGLKIVTIILMLVGAASADFDADDVDADDLDVDADDFDYDAEEIDLDGDGDIDAIEFDSDGDGVMDSVVADTDGDGLVDSIGVDSDGDGALDTIGMDTDGDGYLDTVGADTDGDGALDTIGVDSDGDGYIDTVGADTDGDGYLDTVGADTDGDGYLDTVGADTDGDGFVDTVGADTDGDGYVDTVAVDVDGNGSVDAVGVDVNGDGAVDVAGFDTNGNGTIDTVFVRK